MTSHDSNKSPKIDNHHISRRSFLGTTAAGSAVLLTGGLAALFKDSALGGSSFPFVEATIPQLQAAMTNGQLTSKDLVLGYLNRIQQLNPTLHAVIETNPNAVAIASSLDNERKAGHVRGPLHGIPILVKDNIATRDNMQTTAGSLALYNSQVPADAVIIQRLRAAGAIILGKTNLGEWANFRGFDNVYPLAVGWSARGGDTKNAYDLSYTSWGSGSGSGAGGSLLRCGRNRNGRLDHRSVRCRKHCRSETDARTCLAGWNCSNQSPTGHGRANGPHRYGRGDLARSFAIALRRSCGSFASE
jgi:amidase